MVERFHRQHKDALRARQATTDWPAHLPWALLGLRAAPKEDSGVSSAEMLYGVPLRLPAEPDVAMEAKTSEIEDNSTQSSSHKTYLLHSGLFTISTC